MALLTILQTACEIGVARRPAITQGVPGDTGVVVHEQVLVGVDATAGTPGGVAVDHSRAVKLEMGPIGRGRGSGHRADSATVTACCVADDLRIATDEQPAMAVRGFCMGIRRAAGAVDTATVALGGIAGDGGIDDIEPGTVDVVVRGVIGAVVPLVGVHVDAAAVLQCGVALDGCPSHKRYRSCGAEGVVIAEADGPTVVCRVPRQLAPRDDCGPHGVILINRIAPCDHASGAIDPGFDVDSAPHTSASLGGGPVANELEAVQEDMAPVGPVEEQGSAPLGGIRI